MRTTVLFFALAITALAGCGGAVGEGDDPSDETTAQATASPEAPAGQQAQAETKTTTTTTTKSTTTVKPATDVVKSKEYTDEWSTAL